MNPVKATLLDDDAFRLLAIPFTGPIPTRTAPRGADLDGDWFSPRTDIKPDWLKARDVDFHHGKDDLGVMSPASYARQLQPPKEGREVIGKAIDPVMEDDGWWVTVWLDRGARRLALIQRLAERGAQLFGSSESVAGMTAKAATGEILRWPYWRQTLSTSPQNTHSVLRPMKAMLDDAVGDMYPALTPAFWRDITAEVAGLTSDLRRTSLGGDGAAKAGRTDLEDAVRRMDLASIATLERIAQMRAARPPVAGEGDHDA